MAHYRLSAEAARDLEAISGYIMEDNPLRAVSFVDEIVARFGAIAERPLSFPQSDDLPAGLRSALHGDYRIVFRFESGSTDIIRVIHGARDMEGQF